MLDPKLIRSKTKKVAENLAKRDNNFDLGVFLDLEESSRKIQTEIETLAEYNYNWMLRAGVAPEQARMILPQSMMTEWYWSGTLYAFARVCNLRCAEDAQYETRIVANLINDECEKLFPISWTELRNT